ncbi:low molecular weight protein-tyrosine-phosphatase, putative [Entamoeba invadens IP1]|uniref:acid phosphatase n=1 Tax=Entamoeba invadens IP1 TaxID=370355 RepID=A0A0A1U804_ENTIV|nr:low molecular weight protein-tyrosine-phosphatase, putative [Entamoeba invadens IP1]ELP91028.1 low molecular weight protein-tyrosine-phosphatase, putative [Entamoeba invadens IP1]|eukprot:XP_004257799.1 low molecular weight protein-tyrosine-phosphatase, putative [Entamoeba invadens IP1]
MKILFVCLGNICRSPAADGVMKKLVKSRGLSAKYIIDSAGTAGYHSGDQPDSRMRAAGLGRGYTFDHISRQVKQSDFSNFDIIVAMDDSNYSDLMYNCPKEYQDKIHKMVEYCKKSKDSEVPDPYYSGLKGFQKVIDMLEDGCKNLLDQLENAGDE